MKKNILKSLFMSVLCILAVSCQDTDDFVNTLEMESNKAQVMFSIGMDSPVARSRASWGEDYSPSDGGDAYDNRINPDQLYVKISHGGKTYQVTKILKWQDKNNISSHTFIGEVEIDLKAGESKTMEDARIEVYANWNPDAATNAGVFNQDAEYIPMWGVQTADITLAKGKRETLNTIYLLRAMAKLQVNLTDEMFNEYALTEVKLNKHNAAGYCMPTLPANGVENTKELGLEEVLNAKADAAPSALTLPVVVEGRNYVVYLPEVENGTTEEDWLKITVQLTEKKDGKLTGNTEEGSFYVKDYTDPDAPVEIDIVRNHWYKYEIKGFAASEILLNYAVLDWQNVGIEIGGEGFLFLNKDVIEIYNSNIDADQLKFSSSSPIKSIELKDIYTHQNNGDIVEGTTDGLSAYYITKYGQKIQLGDDPGFDITDKDDALAREAVILDNISATAEANTLNGGITIKSPFLADPSNEIAELQQNSHYDTPRYLEFLVTNQQGSTATFRVIQYPPTMINNIEGYFSYRDDFTRKDGEGPAYWTNYMGVGSITTMGIILTHEHDWTNEANQSEEWFATRQSDRSYAWTTQCESTGKGEERWEEMRYSMIMHYVNFKNSKGNETTGGFTGGYRSYEPSSPIFFRERYKGLPGATNMDTKGAAVGPSYEREITLADGTAETRTFRKHYSWDIQTIYWSKYVKKVHQEDTEITVNNKKYKRLKGQANMYSISDNYTTYKAGGDVYNPDDVVSGGGKFVDYGLGALWKNHRMYHIKATTTSDKYTLGRPTLLDEQGNPTDDADRGVVDNTPSNANLVSPSLMLASQLGETDYNYIIKNCQKYGYNLPKLSDFYTVAKNHCREYVESTWEDTNGNGQPDEGEPVTQYHDWRLPTKAEIEMIIDYQSNSRAMDVVLMGEHFVCITGQPGQGDDEKYWVSSEVPTYKVSAEDDIDGIGYTNTGYYIRCVRDVKPNENK